MIKEGAFLVDVRTPAEFSAGSVPDAINIPLSQVPSRLEEFNDHKNIVVFCKSGNRSGQAERILEDNGFENVMNGGTWQNVRKVKEQVEKE